MARVIYAARALADLERLTDFLVQTDPVAALETVGLITEAVHVLENHPLIGRTAEQGFRELVISRGMSGYLALYSYDAGYQAMAERFAATTPMARMQRPDDVPGTVAYFASDDAGYVTGQVLSVDGGRSMH